MFRCVRRTWMMPSNAKLKLSRIDWARRWLIRTIAPLAAPSRSRGRSRGGAAARARAGRATVRRRPAGRGSRRQAGAAAQGPPSRGCRSGTRARRSPRRSPGARASAFASPRARRSAGRAHLRRFLPLTARSGRAPPPRSPRPRRRCGLPPRPRPSLATALRARLLRMELVRLDDPLHESMPDHILVPEPDEGDPLDRAEDVLDVDEPRRLLAGKVDLGDGAGDNDLRAEAESRQEHLHLLGSRVLGLVEDDEGVVERPAAHEGERRDLDRALLHVGGETVG